jgi:copper chaperone NosL
VAAVAALAMIVAVVALVVRRGPLPDRPVPIVWNRESCAHCRMAIGDPSFAAQLASDTGEVWSFDDPGCLLRFVDERRPTVHRMWFHEHGRDTWLGSAEVGFSTGAVSPMGWGLAAVPRREGALDLDAARAWVQSGRAAMRGAP